MSVNSAHVLYTPSSVRPRHFRLSLALPQTCSHAHLAHIAPSSSSSIRALAFCSLVTRQQGTRKDKGYDTHAHQHNRYGAITAPAPQDHIAAELRAAWPTPSTHALFHNTIHTPPHSAERGGPRDEVGALKESQARELWQLPLSS
mmetsp:Transcript_1817/g.4766  ORF Transcript_1817/g.4766 Transcript_1817/m.4766 type:complete len:145 (+) Transcript_1817:37-471(+)|eukprot:scaffold115699_cov28-Tisochrysis_lutea.AAC.1